jgi:hypothetical protein
MYGSLLYLARLTCRVVVLLSATTSLAKGEDCSWRCSGHRWHRSYSREANHGLIHFPGATYWGSGDTRNRWDAGQTAGYPTKPIAPSPWAYRSIAPYSAHYHFHYGDSYGWDGCFDCRN